MTNHTQYETQIRYARGSAGLYIIWMRTANAEAWSLRDRWMNVSNPDTQKGLKRELETELPQLIDVYERKLAWDEANSY